MRFLGTCRQIYEEAHILMYQAYTFSFDASWTLYSFMRTIPGSCHVRSIRVEYWIGNGPTVEIWAEIMYKVVRHMKDLKEVHFTFEQFHVKGEEYQGPDIDTSEIIDTLSCLTKSPLQAATVIITDAHEPTGDTDGDDEPWLQRGRWTMVQKQEWSKHFRNMLLRRL